MFWSSRLVWYSVLLKISLILTFGEQAKSSVLFFNLPGEVQNIPHYISDIKKCKVSNFEFIKCAKTYELLYIDWHFTSLLSCFFWGDHFWFNVDQVFWFSFSYCLLFIFCCYHILIFNWLKEFLKHAYIHTLSNTYHRTKIESYIKTKILLSLLVFCRPKKHVH